MKKLFLASLAFVLGLLLVGSSFSAEEVVSEETLEKLTTLGKFHNCTDYKEANETNTYCDVVLKKGSTESRFEQIKKSYHSRTNTAFNALFGKLAKTTFQTDQNRERIAEQTEFANVYILRQVELRAYISALETLRQSTQLCEDSPDQLDDAIDCFDALKNSLAFEQITAEKVLRITLSSYAEMRLLYPLHAELENLISKTKNLRDMWKEYVTQVSRMPAKFINAASQ